MHNSATTLASAGGVAVAAPTKRQKTAQRIKRFVEERGLARNAWSISEWAAMKGLSRNSFYRLSQDDRPATIVVGNKALITAQADAEWQQRMLERARVRREPEA